MLISGFASSKEDFRKYQNELFDLEKKRQQDAVGRIEKIEVRYLGVPEDTTLIMNKNLSTPFDCAQRKTNKYRYLVYTIIIIIISTPLVSSIHL